MSHCLEQAHNHNLSSVTLNYPCLICRPRVVSHNRMKCSVAGPVSRITLCLSYPCRFTTHPSDPRWGSDPLWGPRGRRRCFYALMVGTSGSPTTPTRWSTIDVFNIDGGCSWISDNTHQGPASDIFNIDVGTPESSGITSQGTRCRCFLVSMVGAPGSSDSTRQGSHHQCFQELMVGALEFFNTTSQGARR
jgi:hypothetical protein